MSGKVYFITGASRGIGFELVKRLSDSQNTVIACARNPDTSTQLNEFAKEHKNVHIVKLDVSSKSSIEQLDSQLSKVASDGIDVFVSNAGIATSESYSPVLSTDWDTWTDHLTTNTIGAVFAAKAVYPFLLQKQTRQIFFISSLAGSLTGFLEQLSTSAYGASKSALNFAALSLASELKPEEFTVVAIHPGVVKTDLFDTVNANILKYHPEIKEWFETATINPEQSAEGLLEVFRSTTKDSNGKFIDYQGNEMPY